MGASPPALNTTERKKQVPNNKPNVDVRGWVDNADAIWYQDDTIVNSMSSSSVDNFGNSVSISNNRSSDIAISIADSVDNPSISNEPHNQKPRLLARYNTEEAVAKAFGSNDD